MGLRSRLLPTCLPLQTVTLLGAQAVFAASLPSYCDRADVLKISVPLTPDEPQSPTFDYRYQIFRNGGPNDPVIIVMPGGPGETSISDKPEFSPFIGQGFNLIFTDQRSVGCNATVDEHFPDSAFSTRNFAEDVIALIKHEGLSNYILYGHSYGTVHATVTASLIEQKIKSGERIALPKALVLEGVVGRAFQPGESLRNYQNEWSKLLNDLPKSTADQLREALPPFSEQVDASENWGGYLFNQLYLGRFPDDLVAARSINLPWKLKAVFEAGDQTQKAQLKSAVLSSKNEDYGYTFRVLGCREVFADFPGKFALRSGVLQGIGNFCEGLRLERPYDSKDWPNSIPVFYFQGTNDQATPLSQEQYHFTNQRSGKKLALWIGGASHMPVSYSMFYAGCKKTIWNSVVNLGLGMKEVVASCKWPWPIQIIENKTSEAL